jgi:hypothetical protein
MYCARGGATTADHFFDGFAIAQTIGYRGDVVHAVERRNKLTEGLVLAQFLHAAMEVADHTLCIDDAFPIQLQFDLKHSVRRRMLRPHADCQFTCVK